MCVITPSPDATSLPELMDTTGMPAATARRIAGPSAPLSGIDTTSPSGLVATAASISCDMATMSNVPGDWYSTPTPRSLPAASTPFLTTDQNGSDAWPCTTTTN